MNLRLALTLALGLFFGNASADDQQFIFEDTFRNLDNIPQSSKPDYMFYSLWSSYINAVKEINKPINVSDSSYSRDQMIAWVTTARYSRLLETMLELRAFTAQNKIAAPPEQLTIIKQVDSILRGWNLYYERNETEKLHEFCNKIGIDTLKETLIPLTKS